MTPTPLSSEWKLVAKIFTRLGWTAFGGPAAHIALMEEEFVRRREWLNRSEFLDLLAATNLIPGPNSTELALHIGYRRAGWRGLLAAGAGFISPAVLLVTALAYLYDSWGTKPEWAGLMWGIRPVMMAILLQALWSLGQGYRQRRESWLGLSLCLLFLGFGFSEILVLACAGVGGLLWYHLQAGRGQGMPMGFLLWPWESSPDLLLTHLVGTKPSLLGLGLVFLKAGSLLFGSGYVLLSFLETDLVQILGWLTQDQLLDAIAIGQLTPGPVLSTASFVGYLLGGFPGAIWASVAIFLPAFILVALTAPILPRLRGSKSLSSVLDALQLASLALLIHVAWKLGQSSLDSFGALVLCALASFGLLRLKLNSTYLILGAGLLGLVLSTLAP